MENNPWVSELTWEMCYPELLKVNPTLAEIIHALQLPQDYTLFKVRYPYGTKIVEQGELRLPMSHGRALPLSHACIPSQVRAQLDYSFMPVGVILTKTAEIYFSGKTRTIPAKLYKAGDMTGLWGLLDAPEERYIKNILNLSAGARTLFMLPMISDNVGHARIKRALSIHGYPPKTLLDHHELFTDIAKQSGAAADWCCEVLFFSKPWADKKRTELMALRNYWLEQAWKHSAYCRHQMVLDVAQEAFSEAVSRRNLKTKPYIINTFNHLINIGRGTAPGFVAAGTNDDVAPVRLLQDAYVNHYLLKEYAPIIMHPQHLNAEGGCDKVYYSLSLPTLLNYGPRPGRMPSIMADLRELKLLFDFADEYYEDIAVEYKLFHTEPDQFGEVYHSQMLPQLDSQLVAYPAIYQKRLFPYTSSFFRGCIQIARREGAR